VSYIASGIQSLFYVFDIPIYTRKCPTYTNTHTYTQTHTHTHKHTHTHTHTHHIARAHTHMHAHSPPARTHDMTHILEGSIRHVGTLWSRVVVVVVGGGRWGRGRVGGMAFIDGGRGGGAKWRISNTIQPILDSINKQRCNSVRKKCHGGREGSLNTSKRARGRVRERE
jgi:hypothetical protein